MAEVEDSKRCLMVQSIIVFPFLSEEKWWRRLTLLHGGKRNVTPEHL